MEPNLCGKTQHCSIYLEDVQPPKTNGWNLKIAKIHPKGKEKETSFKSTNFGVRKPFVFGVFGVFFPVVISHRRLFEKEGIQNGGFKRSFYPT